MIAKAIVRMLVGGADAAIANLSVYVASWYSSSD